jgi:hypothetical protein
MKNELLHFNDRSRIVDCNSSELNQGSNQGQNQETLKVLDFNRFSQARI